MLVVLSSLLGIVVVLWSVRALLKPLLKARSRTDVATYFNTHNANLQTGLRISEVGVTAEARHSHDMSHHRTTAGIRFLATVTTPALFLVGNAMLIDAAGASVPVHLAPWLGLALLGVCLWYLVYIWSYAIELTRDTIRIPSPFLVRRSFPLSELTDLTDTGGYHAKLRFRSGRRAEVLKYVVGRDALMAALERHVTASSEGACQNSRRSKPSVAGFSR